MNVAQVSGNIYVTREFDPDVPTRRRTWRVTATQSHNLSYPGGVGTRR